MIKQVYMVQVNDRFGYADTLEQAEELERTFYASYSPAQYAVTNTIQERRENEEGTKLQKMLLFR